MKTILFGLLKCYKPTQVFSRKLVYEIDCLGEKEEVEIDWEMKDPEEHKFNFLEPSRRIDPNYINVGSLSISTDSSNKTNYRTCYYITYKGIVYSIPLTLEESDFVNLQITQLFASIQSENLQILKSVIENEIQKSETHGE